WDAGEYDLFPLIVANLSEENLESAPLILSSRANVTAVDEECNRFRRRRRLGFRPRDGLLLQPGTSTEGSLPDSFQAVWLAERQKLRQQASAPGDRGAANPSLRRSSRT